MPNSITYLVSDLVSQVRVESDLNLSQVFTDDGLAVVISDAGSELRDIFTGTNQYYDVSTFDFTLVGGVGLNSVVLPQDFQAGHSIDVNPATQTPFTLRYLPNWLNRNSYSMPFQVFGNNFGPKAYTFLGNEIVVLPAIYSAGIYRLYYTPTWTPLMLPQLAPEAVSGTAAVLAAIGTAGSMTFTGSKFTQANVGDTVIVTGSAHSQNNGTFVVTIVTDALNIQTSNVAAVADSPTAATATFQPLGTRSTLPQNMNPWVQYLKTQAIISVRVKRGQPVESFEARLQVQKDRIQTILQDRKEEPNQPPLLRGRGDMFGDGTGGGWGSF